jgi:MoaA/NifB/PqqE/SkfB family radical SAM enzyme
MTKKPTSPDHRIRTLPILVVSPHNRCNGRCLMCDIWRIQQVQEITTRDLASHLDSLRALRVRWVVLSGGEPLLHTDLENLCLVLRAEGIRLTLLTAGLSLEMKAKLVAENVDDVIVSLDGPPKIHDQIRSVPTAFERLARGVEVLRELRPEIRIGARTTVQKANCQSLRDTVQTAKQMKLDSISFLAAAVTSQAFNRPEGWTPDRQSAVALDVQEAANLALEVEALIYENATDLASGFVAEGPEKLRRLVRHYRAHLGQFPPQAPRCNAPWVSAVIEADGTVRPCFFHRSLGNIHTKPLQEILNSEEAIEFREKLDISLNPICQRCVCPLILTEEKAARL